MMSLKNFFANKNVVIEEAKIEASGIKRIAAAEIKVDRATYEIDKASKKLTSDYNRVVKDISADHEIEVKRIKADTRSKLMLYLRITILKPVNLKLRQKCLMSFLRQS